MKHTAANTTTLAAIKRIFNGKIYKKALAAYNESGEEAALEFVQQFTTRPIRDVLGEDNPQ